MVLFLLIYFVRLTILLAVFVSVRVFVQFFLPDAMFIAIYNFFVRWNFNFLIHFFVFPDFKK